MLPALLTWALRNLSFAQQRGRGTSIWTSAMLLLVVGVGTLVLAVAVRHNANGPEDTRWKRWACPGSGQPGEHKLDAVGPTFTAILHSVTGPRNVRAGQS